MLSLTLSLKAPRVKLSLSTEDSMRGPLSIVRGSLITKSQSDWRGVYPGLSGSPCRPAVPPAHLSLTWTLFSGAPSASSTLNFSKLSQFMNPLSILCLCTYLSLYLELLATPHPSCLTPLFTVSWQCTHSNASSRLRPECLGSSSRLFWLVILGCVSCLSSPPTVGSSWAGPCVAHSPTPSCCHTAWPMRSARADWLDMWINNLPTYDHRLYCSSSRALSRLPLESGAPLGFQM